MKAPTSLFDRPGRAAAVVGAVVAVSASAAVALVSGTAVADEPARCTENVNVRAEPDIESPIVALCEAGAEVQSGESREGFVQLTSLGGWAAQEYISVNGQNPAPAERASASESAEDENEASGDGSADGEQAGTSEDGADGAGRETGEEEAGDGTAEETGEEDSQEPSGQQSGGGSGGGLGGLLG